MYSLNDNASLAHIADLDEHLDDAIRAVRKTCRSLEGESLNYAEEVLDELHGIRRRARILQAYARRDAGERRARVSPHDAPMSEAHTRAPLAASGGTER